MECVTSPRARVALPVVGDEIAVAAAPRPELARAALVVAPATMAANVLGYVFTVVVSRALGPDGFGALGALLGLLLIGAVPALALQAVSARRVALAESAGADVAAVVRRMLRASLLLGAGTTAVLLLGSPALAAYLHLDSLVPVAWLAASLAPLAVISAAQGVLQGSERFRALAVVFVAAALFRVAGGIAAVVAGAGLSGVLAATTAGSAVAALVAVVLLRGARSGAPAPPPEGLMRELGAATFGLLAVVALANVDVLLARHHLSAREAGLYAVGAVLAKIAFWAPQVVAVVVFPRLAGDRAREVLRTALLCLGGFGLLLVVGAFLLARPALLLVFGEEYVDLAPAAWAFVALGSTLAIAHLLVVNGIAARTSRLAVLVAAAVVAEALVISLWLHSTVDEVVGVALTTVVVVAVVGIALASRRRAA